MKDADEISDTYLYKLSEQEGLNWFQNVMILASSQDKYAPYRSASIQLSIEEAKKDREIVQMAQNIVASASLSNFVRVNVWFNNDRGKIEEIVG